ncbi:hypothetical protein [Leptolyngbya sp. 7M]|uniref:hypothetical protein n=1 Tax=Leptolyngbya sp. 7M TaxID=2812896 RepID=UPI002938E8EA|nr:hypothetical protein [Leptolyngbya sp. 7M]
MVNTVPNNPSTAANSLPPADSRERVSAFLKGLQDSICQGLEQLDGGGNFQEDTGGLTLGSFT